MGDIWIATFAYGGPDMVLGAFTDKPELVAWLRATADPTMYLIKRCQDGDINNLPVVMRAIDVLTS